MDEFRIFEILDIKKDKDFISLKITDNSYPMINIISNHETHVLFSYGLKEDYFNKFLSNEKLITFDVIKNNDIFEYLSFDYRKSYVLIIDLSKHQILKQKCFNIDYELKISYNIDKKFFIINLIYSPDLRKIKIEKIIKRIHNVI